MKLNKEEVRGLNRISFHIRKLMMIFVIRLKKMKFKKSRRKNLGFKRLILKTKINKQAR
jgi:hypothetical protein